MYALQVVPGGIIYVDDYGSFNGCRRAVGDPCLLPARPVLLLTHSWLGGAHLHKPCNYH